MKRWALVIIFVWMGLISCIASAMDGNTKEILMRLPLLSEKNAGIISKEFNKINGIEKIDACYELRLLIVEYDADKITDENYLIDLINGLGINTVAEKIFARDIPIIREKYKVTKVYTREKELK